MSVLYLPIPILSDNDIARFHAKYTKGRKNVCWNWHASKNNEGRGKFGIGDKTYVAPRVAYFISSGEDPEHLQVQHTCNNPSCVNPNHLIKGTQQQNVHYMEKCGRSNKATGIKHGTKTKPHRIPRGDRSGSRTKPESRPRGDNHWTKTRPHLVAKGSKNGAAKLTEKKAKKILRMYSTGLFTQQKLADQSNLNKETIGKLIRGETWAHCHQNKE